MVDTLHTKGAVPEHTATEQSLEADDKFIKWEAIRLLVMTIGARDGLERALCQQKEAS